MPNSIQIRPTTAWKEHIHRMSQAAHNIDGVLRVTRRLEYLHSLHHMLSQTMLKIIIVIFN